MKIFRKAMCFVVALAIVLSVSTVAFSAQTTAKLYTFYQSNMLFQQNKKSTVAGTANKGDKVSLTLYDKNSKNIAYSEDTVGNDKIFETSFTAPKGSYNEYRIVMAVNGKTFATLTGIVFGELWLASGQSNMQLLLNTCSTWNEFVEEGFGSPWIRVMLGNTSPCGKDGIPNYCVEDYPGTTWVKASQYEVGPMSALAYYFAAKLQKQLNVPVGILNISLGSTWIRSWLSREAIEGNETVLNILKNNGSYVSSEDYNPKTADMLNTIGANYNTKIYPVRRLAINGMIWYQGENDMMYGAQYGEYTTQLELLQKLYTKTFSYTDGLLPIVYSPAASSPFQTTSRELQCYNAELAEFQLKDTKTRAMITLYDLPLDYSEVTYVYHPWVKKPIGERMYECAMGLVYKKSTTYSAASLKSFEIRDNAVYMKFANVGDGLKFKGGVIYGFLACGEDGVYYKANASIISKDTVKVWRDDIKNIKSATYAFSQENGRSNLWSTLNGNYFMPVSASITDRSVGTVYSSDYVFADCDQAEYWRTEGHLLAGNYKIFQADGCSYQLSKSSAYAGYNGLSVTNSKNSFALKHVIYEGKLFEDGIRFYETNSDWSKYGSLSFKVRNTGKNDVAFSGIKFKTGALKWFAPSYDGEYIIPSDNQWHTITVQMNNLSMFATFFSSKNSLKDVWEMDVEFTGKVGSTLDVDSFEFSPISSKKMNFIEKFFNNILAKAKKSIASTKALF